MFEQELKEREQQDLLRKLVRVEAGNGPFVTVNGRQALLMCSNDYLGLAAHPVLVKAASEAMSRLGFGSGASRFVSGNRELHEELERRIAAFKEADAALLFNTGYAANTGVIPALAGEGDAVFSDQLNHASIIDGCRLSRARTLVYRHGDMDHLGSLLKEQGAARRKLIVTDGVFSMDGDIAPLPDLVTLAERHGAILMVDDAHATGVLGARGRGTVEHFGLAGRVPVQMGTLGKALGTFGAFVSGDRGLVSYLLNTARSSLFSTALPPAVCAASLAAFDVMENEPWRLETLRRNRDRIGTLLRQRNIDIGGSRTPILPVLAGSNRRALAASERALELGIFVTAIRPPTVPEGSSRLRLTVTAAHADHDIDRAAEVLGALRSEGYLQDERS